MASGAGHLPVIIPQGESGQLVLERVLSTDTVPLDDVDGAPFVFGMATDAGLAAEGRMQAALVLYRTMATQTLAWRNPLALLVTFWATVGVVVGRMPFIERSGRNAKIVLAPCQWSKEQHC